MKKPGSSSRAGLKSLKLQGDYVEPQPGPMFTRVNEITTGPSAHLENRFIRLQLQKVAEFGNNRPIWKMPLLPVIRMSARPSRAHRKLLNHWNTSRYGWRRDKCSQSRRVA